MAHAIGCVEGFAAEARQDLGVLDQAASVDRARGAHEDARGLVALGICYSRRAIQRRIARRQTKRDRLTIPSAGAITRVSLNDRLLGADALLARLDELRCEERLK